MRRWFGVHHWVTVWSMQECCRSIQICRIIFIKICHIQVCEGGSWVLSQPSLVLYNSIVHAKCWSISFKTYYRGRSNRNTKKMLRASEPGGNNLYIVHMFTNSICAWTLFEHVITVHLFPEKVTAVHLENFMYFFNIFGDAYYYVFHKVPAYTWWSNSTIFLNV